MKGRERKTRKLLLLCLALMMAAGDNAEAAEIIGTLTFIPR